MSAKVPPAFKPIAHYIKIANENASRDPVIYYWCLFYAVQSAMQLERSSPEALQYLTGLLTTLEAIKKQLHDNDAIKNETIAQAHIEDFALKLFKFADNKEKSGNVDKTVVHAFYTAGYIMDILSLFGEIDEPFASSKKYAKWKSTQIFACLRDGTPYVPSSQQEKSEEDDLAAFGEQFQPAGAGGGGGGSAPSSSASLPTGPQEHLYPSPNSSAPPTIGFSGLPAVPPRANIPVEQPSIPSSTYAPPPPTQSSGGQPSSEEFSEMRKYTKYALSSIDYEDTKAIRDNLMKALAIIEKY